MQQSVHGSHLIRRFDGLDHSGLGTQCMMYAVLRTRLAAAGRKCSQACGMQIDQSNNALIANRISHRSPRSWSRQSIPSYPAMSPISRSVRLLDVSICVYMQTAKRLDQLQVT